MNLTSAIQFTIAGIATVGAVAMYANSEPSPANDQRTAAMLLGAAGCALGGVSNLAPGRMPLATIGMLMTLGGAYGVTTS